MIREGLISPSRRKDTIYLEYLFRVMGVAIDRNDNYRWKCYNLLILLTHFLLVGLMTWSFVKNVKTTSFTFISLMIFVVAGTASYCNLCLTPYRDANLLHLLQTMSAGESNMFGRHHSVYEKTDENGNTLLRQTLRFWLILVIVASLFNFSLIFIAHGRHAINSYLDVSSSNWSFLYVAFIYLNLSWLTPMAVVRISAFFLERRITALVRYLESAHSDDIAIPHVMGWYEDLYESNMHLDRVVSPLVSQCIVLYFVLVAFLLQVFTQGTQYPVADSLAILFFHLIHALIVFNVKYLLA